MNPQIDYEAPNGEAWAKCGCSGYMEEKDFITLIFVVTNPCPNHAEKEYSTKGQTWGQGIWGPQSSELDSNTENEK